VGIGWWRGCLRKQWGKLTQTARYGRQDLRNWERGHVIKSQNHVPRRPFRIVGESTLSMIRYKEKGGSEDERGQSLDGEEGMDWALNNRSAQKKRRGNVLAEKAVR